MLVLGGLRLVFFSDCVAELAGCLPGMTAENFEALLARQMPDVDKRARAHYVVVTDQGLDHARQQVRMILSDIAKKIS